jgi:hypothetical protein
MRLQQNERQQKAILTKSASFKKTKVMADPLNIAHLGKDELEGVAPPTPVVTHVGVTSSETLLPPGHPGIPGTRVGSQLTFTARWLQYFAHPERATGRTKSQLEQEIVDAATSDGDAPQELDAYNTLSKLVTGIDLGDFEVRDHFWSLTPENAVGSLQSRLTQHAIERPAAMLLLFDNSRVFGVKGQLGQQYVLVDATTGMLHTLSNPLFALPAYIEKHCKGAKVAGVVMVSKPPKEKQEQVPVEPEPESEPEPEPEPMEQEDDEVEQEEGEEEEGEEEEQSLASMMKPTKRTRRSSRRRRK